MTQGRGKSIEGVQNAEVSLVTYQGDSTIEMGTIQTDTLGEAALYIEADYPFSINEDGYSVIDVSYDGNDSLRSAGKQIEFIDLNLALSLEEVDSVKHLKISAVHMVTEGSEPVEELKVKIGVERLYSNLYLSEVVTDEEGVASYTFPNDIPRRFNR